MDRITYERSLNYITTQGGVFTTGRWLRLQGEHGSIRVNGVLGSLPWAVQLDPGNGATREAVPDRGYRFTQWSGHLDGSANPAELMVDADKDVTVQFEAMPPPVAPELRWTETSRYKRDGVRPDAATGERTFRFSVTYSAEDGYPPLGGKVELRVRRFDVVTDVDHTKVSLTGSATDCVAGREYSGKVSLGKGRYQR